MCFTVWLCLPRTQNFQIHDYDCLNIDHGEDFPIQIDGVYLPLGY